MLPTYPSTSSQTVQASSHQYPHNRQNPHISHPPIIPNTGLVCPRHAHPPPGMTAPMMPVPQPPIPTVQPTHTRSTGHVSPHYHFTNPHAPSGHSYPVSPPRSAPQFLEDLFPQYPNILPPRQPNATWNRSPSPTVETTFNESQGVAQWRSSHAPPPSTAHLPSSPPRTHLPRSSSQSSDSDSSFYDDDGISQQDPEFFAQLDALERDLTTQQSETHNGECKL